MKKWTRIWCLLFLAHSVHVNFWTEAAVDVNVIRTQYATQTQHAKTQTSRTQKFVGGKHDGLDTD